MKLKLSWATVRCAPGNPVCVMWSAYAWRNSQELDTGAPDKFSEEYPQSVGFAEVFGIVDEITQSVAPNVPVLPRGCSESPRRSLDQFDRSFLLLRAPPTPR